MFYYSLIHFSLCYFLFNCVTFVYNVKFMHIYSSYYDDSSETRERKMKIAKYNKQINLTKTNFVPLVFRDEVPTERCELIFHVSKRMICHGVISVKNCTAGDFGNKLRPRDTLSPPEVRYNWNENYYYTLLMLDVDAPNIRKPIHRHWLHWMVVNIPGHKGKTLEGEVLAEYMPPWPQKLTGNHRYVVLLYEHPDLIKFDEGPVIPQNYFLPRRNFSNLNFEEKYNLGIAKALNFFRVAWDKRAAKFFELIKPIGTDDVIN